jgi:hypothetical protein
MLANGDGEVGTIAIDKFKRCLGDTRAYMEVESKFCCGEIFGLVFLAFVTEELEILLYFLVLALDFAISFRVVGSSEASCNTKTLV